MNHQKGNGNGAGAMHVATGVAPPHSLEAEQSVLGGILLSDRAMYGLVIEEGLRPEDFYRDRHRLIYESMLALYRDGEPIDVLTVSEHARSLGRLEDAGGRAAIDALTGGVPGLGGIRRYAQIVREHALIRRLLTTTYEIQASVLNHSAPPSELVDLAEQQIFNLRARERAGRDVTLADAVSEELVRIEQAAKSERDYIGLTCGLGALDAVTGGWQPGNLIVLASRPGMGKSSVALNFATHAAFKEDAAVLFCSLEMSTSETVQRYLSTETGLATDKLRRGDVRAPDWPKLLDAGARTDRARFRLLDDPSVTPTQLRAQARAISAREGGLDLIIVDYLQLMRPDVASGNRTEDVSSLSRALKLLAMELACPVIALSQLSRAVEQRTDKRPLLADLRESGSIEADADIVLMLYRDDYYDDESPRPDEIDVLVRKNRHGRLDELAFKWQPQRMRVLPLTGT
jgi:replicative DNA helicase